jgi:hypothetical protein
MACHSSSDLVLLASDIFRTVVNVMWVGKAQTVGRYIYLNDLAALLSEDVMCSDASAHSLIEPLAQHVFTEFAT